MIYGNENLRGGAHYPAPCLGDPWTTSCAASCGAGLGALVSLDCASNHFHPELVAHMPGLIGNLNFKKLCHLLHTVCCDFDCFVGMCLRICHIHNETVE